MTSFKSTSCYFLLGAVLISSPFASVYSKSIYSDNYCTFLQNNFAVSGTALNMSSHGFPVEIDLDEQLQVDASNPDLLIRAYTSKGFTVNFMHMGEWDSNMEQLKAELKDGTYFCTRIVEEGTDYVIYEYNDTAFKVKGLKFIAIRPNGDKFYQFEAMSKVMNYNCSDEEFMKYAAKLKAAKDV